MLPEEEVYRCEDCIMFNGDSDVDEGEDEIALQPDGTATRHFRFKKSWVPDRPDEPGEGVVTGSQRGTWSKSQGKLRLKWEDKPRHKGEAPTMFAIVNDGVELSSDYSPYDHAASQKAGTTVFTPKVRLYARASQKNSSE